MVAEKKKIHPTIRDLLSHDANLNDESLSHNL